MFLTYSLMFHCIFLIYFFVGILFIPCAFFLLLLTGWACWDWTSFHSTPFSYVIVKRKLSENSTLSGLPSNTRFNGFFKRYSYFSRVSKQHPSHLVFFQTQCIDFFICPFCRCFKLFSSFIFYLLVTPFIWFVFFSLEAWNGTLSWRLCFVRNRHETQCYRDQSRMSRPLLGNCRRCRFLIAWWTTPTHSTLMGTLEMRQEITQPAFLRLLLPTSTIEMQEDERVFLVELHFEKNKIK